ncbi:hypothetical protein KNE206_53080 [Kitasatospora sp. NE20-6]
MWSAAAALSLAAVIAARHATDRWDLLPVGITSAAAMCTATPATTVLLVLAPLPLAGLLVASTAAVVMAGTWWCFRSLRTHRTAWEKADHAEQLRAAA